MGGCTVQVEVLGVPHFRRSVRRSSGRGEESMDENPIDGRPSSAPSDEPPRPPAPSTAPNADTMASLRNASAGLARALAPLDKSLAPLQGLVAPLEPLGKQMLAFIGAAVLFVGTFLTVRSASASFAGITVVSVSQNLW